MKLGLGEALPLGGSVGPAVRAGGVIITWPEGPTAPGAGRYLGQNRGTPFFPECRGGAWCLIAKGKKCMLVPQLCSTLCDPMNCSLPGSSVLGIL